MMNDSSGNDTDLDGLDDQFVLLWLSFAGQALCFLLGMPALVWCLWLSLSVSLSGGLKPTQVFPINLLAVELVFCFDVLLNLVTYLIQNDTFQQAELFLYDLSWSCRPLIQSCICVEHYLAVVQPVAFLKYRLRRYRVVCSTMVWGFSLAHACFGMHLMSYMEITNYILISVYCFGMAVISFCCFFILRVLKRLGPAEVEGGRGGEKRHKVRVFGIVLTNLVIILASSISVVVGLVSQTPSLDSNCNSFSKLLIVNIFSVIVSPLLHLYREGRLPCRRGPETR